MSMKNSINDAIWNRTRDLPACSAVPQPTASPRASTYTNVFFFNFPRIILPFYFIDVYFDVLITCPNTPPLNTISNLRYVPSNTVACSLNGHTSSAILIPLYHCTGRQHIYGDLNSPASIKHTLVLTYRAGYFFRDFKKD